jgi:hypothetical protein
MSETNELSIELLEPVVELKLKNKGGRPKGSKNRKVTVSEISPVDMYDEPDEPADVDEVYEKYLDQVYTSDSRSELKKLYLNNKQVLDHLNIKQINKMKESDLFNELDLARIMVNNRITSTLSDQLLSVFNSGFGWAFNMDGDFNEYVMSDEMLKSTSNNILSQDLLGHINHRFQFLILYGSKVLEHNRTSKQRMDMAMISQNVKKLEKIGKSSGFVPEVVKVQQQLNLMNDENLDSDIKLS